MYSSKQFYHITSYQSAVQIIKNGFKKGSAGMLGPGIYFAEKPEGAIKKAHATIKDTLLIVVLNTGRLTTETKSHRDWNLQKINDLGYDSVEMRTCRTGPEICVYEPERVHIICLVHWTKTNINFYEVSGLKVDLSDLQFLIEGRNFKIKQYGFPDVGNFPKNFKFNKKYHFKGILNFIQENNINLVDIIVSSFCNKDKNNWPQNLLKYDDTELSFASDDLPNQWICFDFKNHSVIPTHYTIRSSHKKVNTSHLKSWVIEGSNNLQNWNILDKQDNCSDLNGSSNTCSFKLANANDSSYRYLRLKQIGQNWRDRNYLKLNCIDFYGKIL